MIAALVLAFSRGWEGGRTTLDGNGVVLYVDIALHYWRTSGHVPFWVPDLWSGAPVWTLAPIFPVVVLMPLAAWLGPEHAVRVATLSFQIAGGWGAMVLARSLWEDEEGAAAFPAATAAGCLYALHPIVISHGTLFGHETSLGVFAATPWLIWSLRRALRGDGARWAVVAGLLGAFAILHQAEHAYALVLVCALVTVAQLATGVRAAGGLRRSAEGWAGGPARAARRMVASVAAVVAVIAGCVAHWILPLTSLSRSFILSPAGLVSEALANGIAGNVGKAPGAFVTRSPGLAPVVTYARPDLLLAGSFYLGWVWLAGSFVTLVILARRPRRDADGTLAALALASAIGVWMSTAAIPLARSGPALRHQWLDLTAVGLVAGLCIGVYLQRVAPGPVALGVGALAAAGMFAVPYVTPFLALQRWAPLAGDLRFPRLYGLAALGLSLGAAYSLTLIGALPGWWARAGEWEGTPLPSAVSVAAAAAAVALVAVAVVDLWPYRTFYRTRPPADAAPYAAALARIPRDGGRVVTEQFGDPRIVENIYRAGLPQSSGWPHPVSQRQLWDLVVTPQSSAPPGYRDTASALAGTRAQTTEKAPEPPEPDNMAEYNILNHELSQPSVPAPAITSVAVQPINGLPLVRAYDQAVVVGAGPRSPATELAVALVPDHLSVVTGGQAALSTLGPLARGGAVQPTDCSSFGAEPPGAVLGSELAIACAVHRWVLGFPVGKTRMGSGLGAVFEAGTGLEGVSLWLKGPGTGVRMVLRPALSDGTLGPPVASAGPGPLDRAGMTEFMFDAPLPPGRYGFLVTCPGCPGGGPAVGYTGTAAGAGDMLVEGHKLATDLVAGFAPVYHRLAPVAASTADLRTLRRAPGSWDVEVRADRAQLVVVAESDFPGWRATVDGRPAPVLAADRAFLGVVVPAGTHLLRLRYRPPLTAPLGYAVTAITVLVCAAVLFVPRRWWAAGAGLVRAGRPSRRA